MGIILIYSAIYLGIFIPGELVFNLTWFRYLKSYFQFQELKKNGVVINEENDTPVKFLKFNLSTFKGFLERLTISIGLILGLASILIVFGAIKLGTRFKDDQDIKNDYFLIGNFSSILIAILYYYSFKTIMLHYFNTSI